MYTSNFYKIQSPLREGLMPFHLHTHCPVLWLMYHRCSTHAYWNKYDTFPSTYNIPPYKGLNKMKGNCCLLFLSSLNQSFPFLFSLSFLNKNNCYISGTRQAAECSKIFQNTWSFGCLASGQLCLHLTSNILLKILLNRRYDISVCLFQFSWKDEEALTTHKVVSHCSAVK